jgi:hypothetical protein
MSDFNENLILQTVFRKTLKYEMWWKSVQLEPSCSTWTDRHTWLVVAYRNFEIEPKNTTPVDIVSRLSSIPGEVRNFSPHKLAHYCSSARETSYLLGMLQDILSPQQSNRLLKVTTHVYLVKKKHVELCFHALQRLRIKHTDISISSRYMYTCRKPVTFVKRLSLISRLLNLSEGRRRRFSERHV